MQKEISRETAERLARRHRRRTWKKIVSVLACAVVFCTTYALILPAITMEKTPQCGKIEHVHSETCYTQVITENKMALICTLESLELHKHTDTCLDENGKYCCGYSDYIVHEHDGSCYDESGKLWCSLPEIKAHTYSENCYAEPETAPLHIHTDACYTNKLGKLICGKQQVLEHVHSQACFQSVEQPVDTQMLNCTIPEGEGAHIHSKESGCYNENNERTCQLEESSGHHHGALCYGTWELTCNLEEHIHSQECLDDLSADSTADLETADSWENSLPETIPERWDKAVLEVAKSQLGYRESSKNYIEDEKGNKKGYTRYGEWYGDSYGDWCAMFVSFCLHYAGIPNEVIPRETACGQWIETLQKDECDLYRAKESYIPKAGDLIFFDWDEDEIADHVGLVAELLEATETEPAMLRTIEGNSDDCVQYVAYNFDDVRILGYGELPEEPRVEYRWSQDGLEVTASVRESENLPENASLVVQPLSPEDEESLYGERYAASQEEIAAEDAAAITQFDLFKVYLEADGQEILPQKEATVEIRLLEDEPSVLPNVKLFHYSEDGAEKVAPELDKASGSLIGSFDVALSGEYAIVGAQELDGDGPPPRARAAGEETTITPHKTIDAFRDGVDNPDTNLDNQNIDKTDLYRLYLDAELSAINNPIDLLIVVDQSGSMHQNYGWAWNSQGYEIYPDTDPRCVRDMEDNNGNKIYRDYAMQLVLNGTYGNDYDEKKQDGLIYQFLAANDENKVAVVGFQGFGQYGTSYNSNYNARYNIEENADVNGHHDGETLLGWTSTAPEQRVNIEGKVMNATNYCAGFLQAKRLLEDPAVADDGHQKVILFLSDGIPTCHIAEETYRGGKRYYRGGTGQSTEQSTSDATDTYFSNLRTGHEDVIIHTVSIRASNAEQLLQDMATAGGGDCYSVSTTEELKLRLKKLMFGTAYTQLTIEDTLSQYVDLYDGQPDFKVTRKNTDGTVTVLYENGAVTAAGTGVVKSVSYDLATKKVTALFNPTYAAEPGTTVTLSFNVKTNQAAYQEYAKNGYQTIKGEENTDYGGNATSSGQGGFRSNALATVTYKKDDTPGVHQEYPHPVVQAVACKAAIIKTDSRDSGKVLAGAEFALYRKAFEGETGEPLDGQDGNYVRIGEKLTTDTNGQLIMDNLIPADYCLVETKAPAGYRKLTAPVPFTLFRKTDGTGQIVGSDLTITVDEESLPALRVTNIPWDRELPMTGGAGTNLYTIGGLLLVAAAGALLLYKKKKRRKEDFASS